MLKHDDAMLRMAKRIRAMHSLRFTSETLPDIPPPRVGDVGYSSGWLLVVHCSSTRGITYDVVPAWSMSYQHGTGCATPSGGHAAGRDPLKGAIHLFSSEVLALKAARHKILMLASRALVNIDVALGEKPFAGPDMLAAN
jgi:hypothetical protein